MICWPAIVWSFLLIFWVVVLKLLKIDKNLGLFTGIPALILAYLCYYAIASWVTKAKT